MDIKKYTVSRVSQMNIGTVIVIIAAVLIGAPFYGVFSREMSGKAQLREAEWNKQILIEEAKAKKESAILHAEAEIERAKGVAKANEIISDGLRGRSEYLRYLYITGLADLDTQLIYVPTEAGLPILEANRR